MDKRIFLSSPHMGGREMSYIEEAFETNWIAPLGKNVEGLERDLCAYTGRKYAVALSSGTAAIHLGLKYLGVKAGDVVFCSSFTFSGSCNPVAYLGAQPVFIDSDYETYNMDPAALERAYEIYPNPAALVIVNLYGNPANFDALLAVARRHGTPVLEDAAESLGATYGGVQTGNFGDVAVFSFNGNKIITTSGGGMVMLPTEEARKKVLFWATQSREDFPWYQHEELGYNYRLSNISAGIGRGQMEVLDERVAKKRHIRNMYGELLAGLPLRFAPATPNSEPNCWLTVVTLDAACKTTFMDIVNALAAHNVESRPAWKPMHLQPVFRDCGFVTAAARGSVSEDLFSRSVCLPSDSKMTDEEISYVAAIVRETLEKEYRE